jgi:hypothetical protein
MTVISQSYQAFRRPMTDAERKSVDSIYKNLQKQARPAGFLAFVFALIGIFSGEVSDITSLLVLVVGLFSLILAVAVFRLRRKINDVQRDGDVVVVRASVSRFDGKMNTSAMMVGPLAIGWNKRGINPLQEGVFAEVACVPKLRSAVSINGAGLDHPIKMMIPSDLEANASNSAQPSAYELAGTAGPAPNSIPETTRFCTSCGKPTEGLAFCSNCGYRL